VIAGIGLSLAAFAMGWLPIPKGKGEKLLTSDVNTCVSNAKLVELAYNVLEEIKEGDYKELAKYVHPEYGVVFSPYATINLVTNKCFTAAQVENFPQDGNKYVWGLFDGSGEPIEMTPVEYFARFVMDKDFTQAEQLGIDKIIRSGNALENIDEVFPNARYVDFHFEGSPENTGLDWGSLRLGFEDYKGELRLTIILHSEWTI
jgi:hypothetical protein